MRSWQRGEIGLGGRGFRGDARAERKESLEENDKVEEFHSPPESEAWLGVSGEEGVDGGGELEALGGGGKDFNKFWAVPSGDEAEILVHQTVEVAFVLAEEAWLALGILENFFENIGGFFSGVDGEKDSRGEDWVDEASGITGENPAVTGEARVAVGIIASGMDGGDSGILADPLAHEIGIVDRPIEDSFGGLFAGFEIGEIHDEADARAVGIEWD